MSRDVALLNEKTEAVVCKAMVDFTGQKLDEAQDQILRSVMDREAYLMAISRVMVLREMYDHLSKNYRRAFER